MRGAAVRDLELFRFAVFSGVKPAVQNAGHGSGHFLCGIFPSRDGKIPRTKTAEAERTCASSPQSVSTFEMN